MPRLAVPSSLHGCAVQSVCRARSAGDFGHQRLATLHCAPDAGDQLGGSGEAAPGLCNFSADLPCTFVGVQATSDYSRQSKAKPWLAWHPCPEEPNGKGACCCLVVHPGFGWTLSGSLDPPPRLTSGIVVSPTAKHHTTQPQPHHTITTTTTTTTTTDHHCPTLCSPETSPTESDFPNGRRVDICVIMTFCSAAQP